MVSIFLGDELTAILESLENDTAYAAQEAEQLRVGVHTLPRFPKDTTDRNRTSPFAFTGNKFEFRMLGSSQSVSASNVVINTAVAKELDDFATELEAAEDFHAALGALIRRVIKEHKRIIFNGNGYDDAWIAEAQRRGLLNLPTTPDCLPYYLLPKNIELFEKYGVYSEREMRSRYEIHIENYIKVLHIEAHTMVSMAQKDIVPAVVRYGRELADTIVAKRAAVKNGAAAEAKLLKRIDALTDTLCTALDTLREELARVDTMAGEPIEVANAYRDVIVPAMDALRAAADSLEVLVAKDLWPFPSYGDILFSVR